MRLSVNSNGFSFGILYAWCAAAPPILESPSSSTEPFLAPPIAELLVLMALTGRTFGPFLAALAFAASKAGGLALTAARLAFDPPTTILAVLRVLEPGTLLYYELPVPTPLPVVPFDLISKKIYNQLFKKKRKLI